VGGPFALSAAHHAHRRRASQNRVHRGLPSIVTAVPVVGREIIAAATAHPDPIPPAGATRRSSRRTCSSHPYGQNIDPRLLFKELKRVDCCPALRGSWFCRSTAQAMFGDTWAFASSIVVLAHMQSTSSHKIIRDFSATRLLDDSNATALCQLSLSRHCTGPPRRVCVSRGNSRTLSFP
jgi:hypothetical protein